MAAKKSRSTSQSKTGSVAGGKVRGKVTKTPKAKLGGTKMPRTKGIGGSVAKAGRKRVKSGARTIGKVKVDPASLGTVRVEKVPVAGRLVKLGAIDRDGARVLEQVITGASAVTISAGTGKTATLSGA